MTKTIRFPIDCLISVVAGFLDGSLHEVGIVGRDGASGALEILSGSPATYDSFIQIAGTCMEIEASVFLTELDRNAALRTAVIRYAYASQSAAAQLAACNGTHMIEGRSAKWILTAHDRVAGDVIDLTHDFIGEMLNVRRAGVTVAANHLKELGAIRYLRGKITIASRQILEDLSCECYKATNDHSAAILGYDVRKPTSGTRVPPVRA